ncbi:hypothetical protein ACTXOQ_03810 [Glutamicibacter arilaitensis]
MTCTKPATSPLGSAALLFFTVALPLLAGWQVFQVMRSRKRVQA